MIAFAFINADGVPTGGGIGASLPEGAVLLPWPFTTADLPRLRWQDGAWALRDEFTRDAPPTAEELAALGASLLASTRRLGVAQVNAQVDRARQRIYTNITGQDALYLEKRAEAVAFVREAEQSGLPETLDDYPLLAGEVGITAPTAWQLAQIWLHRSDRFKAVGAATERLRMQALLAISAADDIETIEAAQAALVEALSKLPM